MCIEIGFTSLFMFFCRWAQVTEELKEALWELEEEREKQRSQEQELEEENLYTSKQDHFENKDSPFLEEKEDGSSMLFTTTPPSALLADKLPGDLTEVFEEKAHLDLQVRVYL